jgi:hypothetical protein
VAGPGQDARRTGIWIRDMPAAGSDPMAAAEDDLDELGYTDVRHERDSQDGAVPCGEWDEPQAAGDG